MGSIIYIIDLLDPFWPIRNDDSNYKRLKLIKFLQKQLRTTIGMTTTNELPVVDSGVESHPTIMTN